MIHLLAIGSLVLYLIAALGFLGGLMFRKTYPGKWSRTILKAGFVCHTLAICAIFIQAQPVLLESQQDYFFWMSWALPLGFFLLRKKLDYQIIGVFISSATLLFMASSSYMVHKEPAASSPNLWLIALHALPALIAEISLAFALICSCVFLIQSARLKSKSLDSYSLKGPSLESLDRVNHLFIFCGFISMTLAVISGAIWAFSMHKTILRNDFYQWMALLAWILLAFILHSRLSLRWSPRMLSKLTIVVSGCFLLSFFLTAFMRENLMHG